MLQEANSRFNRSGAGSISRPSSGTTTSDTPLRRGAATQSALQIKGSGLTATG